MEFDTRTSEGKIPRPIIHLPISSSSINKKNIACLLDSGADYSTSYKVIGEIYFGLKFTPNDRINMQITGVDTCPNRNCEMHPCHSPVYRKEINVNFNGKKITLPVLWFDRGFNAEEDILLLLGRDFFEHFNVTFKQKDKLIELIKR